MNRTERHVLAHGETKPLCVRVEPFRQRLRYPLDDGTRILRGSMESHRTPSPNILPWAGMGSGGVLPPTEPKATKDGKPRVMAALVDPPRLLNHFHAPG